MSTAGDISTVIVTGVAVGGFVLNALVQWTNGRRANRTAVAQSKVIEATKATVDQTKVMIENVKENTDGRLTEVIQSHGELTGELKTLREELAQEKQNAAVRAVTEEAVPPTSMTAWLDKLAREIEELRKEGKS